MAVTSSEEYLHESACGLQEDTHYINEDFVEVIEEVAHRCDQFGIELDWGAAGCGSCFHTDASGAIFWVAQGDGTDHEALKFGIDHDNMTREELGHLILDVADDLGVDASWNGDTSLSVIIGVAGAYRNYDTGTRVRKVNGRREKTGTVLSTDILYDEDVPIRLWDQSDYDGIGAGGELVGRFKDRESARRFKRNSFHDEFRVDSQIIRGGRDGDNIVLWDGHDTPAIVKARDLEEIDA